MTDTPDDIRITPGAEFTLKDGEILFHKDEAGHVAYAVISGQVEAFIKEDGDRAEIVLATLGEEEIIGHIALLDDMPRSASARARGDAKLRVIGRNEFTTILLQNPEYAQSILNGLAGFVRGANSQIVNSALLSKPKPEASTEALEDSVWDTLLPWRDQVNRTISSFQPDAQEIEQAPFPAIARLTAYSIILFIFFGIVWASVAVIDTAVSTRGETAPKIANIVVQASEAGIIENLYVAAGQRVQAGDPLVQLDDTVINADIAATESNKDFLIAKLARIELELQTNMEMQQPIPTFSTMTAANNSQRDLYLNRAQEYASQIESFDQKIENAVGRIRALGQEVDLARRQLEILNSLEAQRRALFEKNVISQVQLMTTTYDRISIEREILTLSNQLNQVNADRLVTLSEKEVFTNQWFSGVREEALEARTQLIEAEEQLTTLRTRYQNLDIHARADAIVLDTHDFASGSVMRAAEPIVTMVPTDAELMVQVDVNTRDISKNSVGSRVSIKLDAVPFQKHGEIIGRVEYVSEDTFSETLLGEQVPVYRAIVHIEQNNLENLPADFRLIPGMNLTGDIKTGEQRVITYFLYPVMRRLQTSFRES